MPLGTLRDSPLDPASSSISDAAPTGTTFANITTPSPQKLDITYTHHHILSFNTASSSSDNTLASQINALKLSVMSNRPGQLTASENGTADESLSTEAAEQLKAITIDGLSIQYNADTLPEPPTLSYKIHELDRLLHDWDRGDRLVVMGVGIPVCHWQKIYSRTRPKAWKRIKDQWIKYKFIVGGLKFHNGDIEKFWEYLTARAPAESTGQRLTMKGISDILRKIRTERNKSDVQIAREEYGSEKYAEIFSYRKGGRKYIMKREQDIARCYRKTKKITMYWDEDEEPIVEDEDDFE
jgi:hypothetical protein